MIEDFKNISEQLNNRKKKKAQIPFYEAGLNIQVSKELCFLSSASDLGVIRNGGRRGTNFGPRSILASFKKLQSTDLDKMLICEICTQEDNDNYSSMQINSTAAIHHVLKRISANSFWHLGGGHDHIYPLAMALNKVGHRKLTIINIDAHLDTRVDQLKHSGTPFRQIDTEFEGEFELIQLGIHKFSNDDQTAGPLKNGNMTSFSFSETTHELDDILNQKICIKNDHLVLLSLDCDAIDASLMEAVSAVNHAGIKFSDIRKIFSWYKNIQQQRHYYGVYEYNPLFDNLSNKGARALSSLIYDSINKETK